MLFARAGAQCRVTNSVYILGLSAMGHDPAAALIDGQGAIVAKVNRVWFIGTDVSSEAIDPGHARLRLPRNAAEVVQVRSIEAALTTEFPGAKEEKHFPGELVVVLYRK